MSVLLTDVITFYKYGGKQLYYNNTYDGQGEIDIDKEENVKNVQANFVTSVVEDDDCDSCKI